MNDKLKTMILVIFISGVVTLSVFPLEVLSQEDENTIIEVPGDYQTIQSAVNSAENGDIISVDPGTYYEEVVVDKSFVIRASSQDPSETIIEGGRRRHIHCRS